ncbi:MAG: hypothetical protein AAGA15_03645 [Pseudomonadota bacterium]
MIPIVQFDPASMTVWTTVSGFPAKHRADLNSIYRAVIGGTKLKIAVGAYLEDEGYAHEAIVMASNIMHEKRHFFDTLLTNCGARSFRSLFQFAWNFPQLAGHAVLSEEPILLPVEHYACPVQRALYGLGEPPPDIVELARRARNYKAMTRRMQQALSNEKASLELGETGQLEGLAVATQMMQMQHEIGPQASLTFTETELAKHEAGSSYRSIEAMALALGSSVQVREGLTVINPNLASAIFIAGLNGRFFTGSATAEPALSDPGERMAQVMLKLGREDRYGLSDAAAMDLVDGVCRDIWGKTPLEEAFLDLEGMKRFLDRARLAPRGDQALVRVFEDFIELREKILNRLKTEGMALALPNYFAKSWADEIVPLQVEVEAGGIKDGPDGTKRFTKDDICFGQEFFAEGQEDPVAMVTWGLLNRSARSKGTYRFAHSDDWKAMVMTYAPRARAMLNGLRYRRMQANEIDIEIAKLEYGGLSFAIDPMFAGPGAISLTSRRAQAQAILRLTNRDEAVCDISGKALGFEDVALALPSEVRRSPFKEAALAQIGDAYSLEYMHRVDWSDMIVDQAFFQ